jgi:hypothetical protein
MRLKMAIKRLALRTWVGILAIQISVRCQMCTSKWRVLACCPFGIGGSRNVIDATITFTISRSWSMDQ